MFHKVSIYPDQMPYVFIDEVSEMVCLPSPRRYVKFFTDKKDADVFFKEAKIVFLNRALLDLAFSRKYLDWYHEERKILRDAETHFFNNIFSTPYKELLCELRKMYSLVLDDGVCELLEKVNVLEEILSANDDPEKIYLYLDTLRTKNKKQKNIEEKLC